MRIVNIIDHHMTGSCLEGDVRLVSLAGYDRFQEFVFGEVQICLNSLFGSVCDTSWGNQDASVICRQMGFSPLGNNYSNMWMYVYFIMLVCILQEQLGGEEVLKLLTPF